MLGSHALALRRAVTVLVVGLVATLALLPSMPWEFAVVAGRDAAVLAHIFGVVIVAGAINLTAGLRSD